MGKKICERGWFLRLVRAAHLGDHPLNEFASTWRVDLLVNRVAALLIILVVCNERSTTLA